MAIAQHNRNGINIFGLSGVIGVGAESDLHELVQTLVVAGATAFVFDMAQVRHVDSTGIASLIGAYCSITRSGGRLVLTGLSAQVTKVLQITRLLGVFEHAEQLEEGIARLSVAQTEGGRTLGGIAAFQVERPALARIQHA